MRKKVNFLMLTLIAMVASLAFSSCSKDDEPKSVENYYFVLTSVKTNLVDPNTGQSIAPALKEELISGSADFDSNGKFHMGKTTKDSALNAFEQSVEAYKRSFNEAYAGKNLLPEGGFIDYNFVLQTQSGSTVTTSTIRVTNDGATSY